MARGNCDQLSAVGAFPVDAFVELGKHGSSVALGSDRKQLTATLAELKPMGRTARHMHHRARCEHGLDPIDTTMEFTLEDIEGFVPGMEMRTGSLALRTRLMEELICAGLCNRRKHTDHEPTDIERRWALILRNDLRFAHGLTCIRKSVGFAASIGW